MLIATRGASGATNARANGNASFFSVKVMINVSRLVPAGGTSLENAFLALQQLSPSPDNIFLITDGLPTQDSRGPRGTKISGRDRQKLFRAAVKQLPKGVPVNVILAPMEGDPMAAVSYWKLAVNSGGAFLAPSRDWP